MSDDFATTPLVSTQWLADNLAAPDLRVVDASYYLPNEGLDPRHEFEQHHIPGAVFFDIDDIAESDSDLPHMVPSPQKFSSKVRKLGLGDGLRFVIYDQRGIWSAPRAWWMFRYYGHNDVAVLDGGLPKWMAEGRATEDGAVTKSERHFTARLQSLLLREKEQIESNLRTGREQVLDARAQGRFEGTQPELREGLRSGHIPDSLNLAYGNLIDPEDQTLLPREVLRQRFEACGLDLRRPVVTTCGSGVTAAILSLGLHLLGHRDVAVYDGSWSEWGLPGPHPVVAGPAGPQDRATASDG